MDLVFEPLAAHGLDASAAVLTRGFADYFVAIPFTKLTLLHLARADSVDLQASSVVVRGGTPIGAVLIARRGWTCRLAGMSLIPEARRQGVGRAVLQHALTEARRRGERAMELEVIAQNEPAVALYTSAGFERVRGLAGFAAAPWTGASPPSPQATAGCEEVDPRAMAVDISVHGISDLPWQLAAETVAHFTPPTRAWRRGTAQVAFVKPSGGSNIIRALSFPNTEEGRQHAGDLLVTLRSAFPDRGWEMKAVWPEELGTVFTGAGFLRTELSQWQMRRMLPGAPEA